MTTTADIRTARTAVIVSEMLNPESHNRRPGKRIAVKYFDTAYAAAEYAGSVDSDLWIDFEYNV